MNFVYKYATRLVVLNDSKISYDGNKIDLFKNNLYIDNHLEKPEVLKLIDYLNDNLKTNIPYNIFSLEELISYLGKEVYNG